MTKNTFAMGNNVVITKSNIIIRKDEDDDGRKEPWMPSLSQVVEHMILSYKTGDRNNVISSVLDLLAVSPTSPSFDTIQTQVTALFAVQNDRKALRKRITSLLDDVDALSDEAPTDSDSASDETPIDSDSASESESGSDSENSGDSGNKQELLGYRTLFRYSAGGRTYYGWRYPLRYWLIYGRGAGFCGFGHRIGFFFYC